MKVLITGAASGMGKATAEIFAAEGAQVAVTDYNADGAQAVAEAIIADGGRAQAWHLDVSDKEQIVSVANEAAQAFSGLDVVVNNAGIAIFSPIANDDYDDLFARHISVLLTSHQRMVRAALPYLKESPTPRIINVASVEAITAMKTNSPYAAAKAGVAGLTRALAVELGHDGITVNCVCPGPIHTGMTDYISEEHKQKFADRRTVLGRYGSPEEVGHIIVSLAMPAASFITGATIPVDGGVTIRTY